MIEIEKSINKLKEVVALWAEEKPDEYAAVKGIMGNKLRGACDPLKKVDTYHDEYYTSREQIEYLVNLYDPKVFEGKYVYCNCDAPWSEIYKYFRDNFSRLKLKHLTATAISDNNNEWLGTRSDYDGKTESVNLMSWTGTFDSAESRLILSECDMCITNPPFSLISPYMKLMVESGKEFMTFMSNMSITLKYIIAEYVKKSFYIIMSRDHGKTGKTGFSENINYIVVSNIPGSAELERKITLPVKYVDYDPDYHRKVDNVPGAININSLTEGIPLYYKGWIYCPTTIVSDLRWRREDFDVIIPPRNVRDAMVDGKWVFRRIPIKLKNKNLTPTL